MHTLDELIGRPNFPKRRHIPDHPTANTLDLSALLKDVVPDRPPVVLSYEVINTDRNIGTRFSGRIGEIPGQSAYSIHITCRGSTGQSFGCFLVSSMKLEPIGEANDNVGKGMAAGEIVIRVSKRAKFEAATNTICGNTCLYGATGGAGERFAVRNSAATSVVEGVGDHGCEYMTTGTVAVLGKTGKNFAAGMSLGTAYIYDADGNFFSRVNSAMVVALPITRIQHIAEIQTLIALHLEKTGSVQATKLLSNCEKTTLKLVRVIAKERAELEAAEELHEAASTPVGAN